MRINNNLMAMNTHRQLGVSTTMGAKSMEKLSSGFRINRAGDDAAGLAISEKMRAQIRGLNQASRNAQDGISLIQTAEGALSETHEILQRMHELSNQAANGILQPEDAQAITDELSELTTEISRIAQSTKFNGMNLLDGSLGVQIDASSDIQVGTGGVTGIDIAGANPSETYTIAAGANANEVSLTDSKGNVQIVTLADGDAGVLNFDKMGVKITVNDEWAIADLAGDLATTASSSVTLQIGANTGSSERLAISIADMDIANLGIDNLDVSTTENARDAMDSIQNAVNQVSAGRSKLGAYQNRLEHTIKNLDNASENLQAAESRIRDVDMAKEMMEMTKQQILQQASTAMLSQANQAPQGVLQLLR